MDDAEEGRLTAAQATGVEVKCDRAVIRFVRAVNFPRFAMAEGERWSFLVFGKNRRRLEQIRNGERFEFAGGLCLAEDVEILYVGPRGRDEAVAAGRIPARQPEQVGLPCS